MFYEIGIAAGSAITSARLQAEAAYAEERSFMDYLQSLPTDEARQVATAQRVAHKEKMRLEAIDERRHREIVDALRSRRSCSSGWGMLGLGWLIGRS